MEVFAVWCGRGSAAYRKSLQVPVISFCTPGNPCATPIVTHGEGSFSYQGVSTRGVRHSPEIPSDTDPIPDFFIGTTLAAVKRRQSLHQEYAEKMVWKAPAQKGGCQKSAAKVLWVPPPVLTTEAWDTGRGVFVFGAFLGTGFFFGVVTFRRTLASTILGRVALLPACFLVKDSAFL